MILYDLLIHFNLLCYLACGYIPGCHLSYDFFFFNLTVTQGRAAVPRQGCGARELVTGLPSCFFQFGISPWSSPLVLTSRAPCFPQEKNTGVPGRRWEQQELTEQELTEQGFQASENLSHLAPPAGRHMGAKGNLKKGGITWKR